MRLRIFQSGTIRFTVPLFSPFSHLFVPFNMLYFLVLICILYINKILHKIIKIGKEFKNTHVYARPQ